LNKGCLFICLHKKGGKSEARKGGVELLQKKEREKESLWRKKGVRVLNEKGKIIYFFGGKKKMVASERGGMGKKGKEKS